MVVIQLAELLAELCCKGLVGMTLPRPSGSSFKVEAGRAYEGRKDWRH